MLIDKLFKPTHPEGSLDGFGLPMPFTEDHAGPVQVDTQHGDDPFGVIVFDFEAVPIRDTTGHPLVSGGTGVINGQLTGDAIRPADIH